MSPRLRISRAVLAALLITLTLWLGHVQPAQAASFTVNSTLDAPDASGGDGVCATVTGACTLRAAIQEANTSTTADTIDVAPGIYTLSLRGVREDLAATGDLDVTAPVTINGSASGATIIDGNHADRIFDVQPGAAVTIARLGITSRSAATWHSLAPAFRTRRHEAAASITYPGA